MCTLYITRGLPGSGKSTLLKEVVPEAHLRVEVDDYFMISDVHYHFDSDKLKEAHIWCRGVVEGLCRSGIERIGVGNTNIRKSHLIPYIGTGLAYGYKVKILIPNTAWAWDVGECYKRNTHKVPLEVLQEMHNQFEW